MPNPCDEDDNYFQARPDLIDLSYDVIVVLHIYYLRCILRRFCESRELMENQDLRMVSWGIFGHLIVQNSASKEQW